MTIHRIIREGDEFTCTCGLRWDAKEKDPHVKLNGFDLAKPGSERTVKAMFENGELTSIEEQENQNDNGT